MLKNKQTTVSPLSKKGYLDTLCTSIVAFGGLSAVAINSFAAKELGQALVGVCNDIGKLLTQVFGPLCVLILAFAIISIVIGKSSKSADAGMDWAKRAILGFIAFNLLGSILSYGIGLFENTQQWSTVTNGTTAMVSPLIDLTALF